MQRTLRPSRRPVRRLQLRRAAALALVAVGVFPQAAPPVTAAEAAEEPDTKEAATDPASLRNWVELAIGGTIANDDVAAMRYRTGLPKGVYGGIRDLHYEADVAENTLFKLDGRALFDNEDYRLSLDLVRAEVGYLRAGLSQFRSYYDATGGYFPADRLAYDTLFDDAQEVDRREYWFEGGLRRPNWPEITIRYSRFERDGTKGSTIWGDTTTSAGTRKIVPAFLDLDEVRNLYALDVKKGFGRTKVGIGVRYDQLDRDDSKNLRFNPGGGGADSHATQRDVADTDILNAHGSIENRFNDRVWLTVGYAYTDLDTEAGGYRVYGTGYDPDLANRLPNNSAFDNLQSNGRLSQHVANLNLFWNLANRLDLIPSVRVLSQDRTADSSYSQPALPAVPLSYAATSDRGLLDVAGALELRYRGITNVVIFLRGDWLAGQGDLDESWNNVTTATNVVSVVARSTEDQRFWQKYGGGVNWYPLRRLALGAGYYYKVRKNEFDHRQDSTPAPGIDLYPAFLLAQSYSVHDIHGRVTWRPRLNLTLIGRYDVQFGEYLSQGDGTLDEDTAEVTSQIASASLSWVPFTRMYLQGSGSYARDNTEISTLPAPISASVQDAENDYWTVSATVGYALSNEVDVEGSYMHYRADNFADNSAVGMPYGSGLEENWASAALTWRMNPRVRWIARYSYGTSDDETSGGYNDFDVHVVQASMQYRF